MTFTVKRGDTRTALEAVLKNPDGTAVNLTGATVRFYMRPQGTTVNKVNGAAATLADAVNGKVWYVWAAPDVDIEGTFDSEFRVTFTDGKTETYPNDSFIPVCIFRSLA